MSEFITHSREETVALGERLAQHLAPGALIAFTMSFDDFIISYFVTGNGVNNISILVYTMSRRVNPSINALSTLVILLITITLLIVNIVPILKEKRRKNR